MSEAKGKTLSLRISSELDSLIWYLAYAYHLDRNKVASVLMSLAFSNSQPEEIASQLFDQAGRREPEEDATGRIERYRASLESPLFSDPDDLAKIRVRESEDEAAYYSRYGNEE